MIFNKYTISLRFILFLFSFLILSCSGDEAVGSEASSCDSNGLCAPNLVCNNANKCTEKEVACKHVKCSDHGECIIENSKLICECDTGYYSQSLNCIADSNNKECLNNGDCNDGKICKNNTCVENTNPACNPACEDWQNCDNGYCEIKEGRCVNNSHCASGKICENHYCVDDYTPECVTDNDCSNDETCENGSCVVEECVTTKRFEANGLRLNSDEKITLCSSQLVMQGDGNLVLYEVRNEARTGVVFWSSSTQNSGAYFNFQPDGNMVIYKSGEPLGGESIWNSETSSWHRPNDYGHHLIIDNEKMELYDSNNNVIWTTFSTEVAVMNDLLSASTSSASIEVGGYFAVGDGGGGTFAWDASRNKAEADGGVVVDPSVSLVAQGTGVGAGCWVRQFTGAVNILWFGVDITGSSDTRNKLISSFKYTNVLIPSGVKLLSFPISLATTLNLEINGTLTFAGENQNTAFTLNGINNHIFGTGTLKAVHGETYQYLIGIQGSDSIIENLKITVDTVVADPGGSEDGIGITYGRGAIHFINANNSIARNCEVYNWFGAGIYIHESSNMKVLDNYIHDNTLGLFWSSGTNLTVENNFITHNRNVVRAKLHGGSGIVTGTATIGLTFTNNEVSYNNEHGTYIHSVDVLVTGNNVHDNSYQGIKVDCLGPVLIENNTLRHNDPNNGDGEIYVQARWQMQNITIKNNSVASLSSISGKPNIKVSSMKAVIWEWHESAGIKNIHFIGNRTNGFFHVEYTSGFVNTDNTYNGSYFRQEGH